MQYQPIIDMTAPPLRLAQMDGRQALDTDLVQIRGHLLDSLTGLLHCSLSGKHTYKRKASLKEGCPCPLHSVSSLR